MGPFATSIFLHFNGKTMQLIRYVVVLLILVHKLYANNVDRVVEAIETQDITEMIHIFDALEPMTLSEAKVFVNSVYQEFTQTFGVKKKKANSIFSNLHLMACTSPSARIALLSSNRGSFKNTLIITPHDPSLLYHFIKTSLSEYLTDFKIKNLFDRKIHSQLNQISSLLLMCNDFEENVLPTNLILGGVEMFVGVLVAILPFPCAREAGIALILDGTYRAFNGVGELDEQNRAYLFGTDTD